jgi:hypothetical protein
MMLAKHANETKTARIRIMQGCSHEILVALLAEDPDETSQIFAVFALLHCPACLSNLRL